MFGRVLRGTAVLCGIAALAACGDSTGVVTLTPQDVTGSYEVCSLVFQPENPTQPAVDIRTAVFETEDTAGVQQPRLAVDQQPREFALLYTRKGQFVPQNITGNYDLTASGLTLKFPGGSNPGGFLLPDRLALEFQASPMVLWTDSSDRYSVPRSDYARLAGVPETGLADQIPGHLSARFEDRFCH